MHNRSKLRPLALALATCLCLAAPATLGLGPGAATPAEQEPDSTDSDESTCSGAPGYIIQFGENGFEYHWVEDPEQAGYYYHDGTMYWNHGQSC